MAKKKDEHLGVVDKDYEINKLLDDMAEAGMAKTREWCSMWQESLRYFFSDQLHGKKRHKDWDWVIMNYIWPSAMQEVAKLSKHHPRIIAKPYSDDDVEAADVWQGSTQWLWESRLNMRLNQIAAILDGKLFGIRISKVYWENQVEWDDEKKQWTGDVKYKLWHPASFWASPNAETIDEAEALGTERYVPLKWAQQRWPQFKDELALEAKKFTGEGTFGGDTVRGQWGGTWSATGTGGADKDKGQRPNLLALILGIDVMSRAKKSPKEKEMVKITETYFRDYSTTSQKQEEDIPQEELEVSGAIYEDGGIFYDTKKNTPINPADWPKRTVREWEEPKYPFGRYIMRVGHYILNPEEAQQRYPYKRWPFVVTPHYLLPHMWQGLNAVDLYKDTQDLINVTASHLVNNMKHFGDPKIWVEDGALSVNPRTKKAYAIGKGAGAVIRVVKGALSGRAPKAKIEVPPQMPQTNLLLYQLLTQEYKNLTGLQSVSTGEKDPGEMSATQSAYLAISSNDRIALQSVYEDEWIKGVASLIAELTQANYDVDRFVRIVGEDKIEGVIQITQKLKDVRFDIDIEAGTTLPFDEEKRIIKYAEAYKLLSDPNPNPMLPDMLRILEIPNWKKLISQHQMWMLWVQFQQLIEAVRNKQIAPEQAIQMLVQKATVYFTGQQNTTEGVAARNLKQEEMDAEYEKRRKQEKAEEKKKNA